MYYVLCTIFEYFIFSVLMYFLLKVLKCTKIGRFERKMAIFDGMTEKSDQKLSKKIDLFIVETSKIHKVEFLVD